MEKQKTAWGYNVPGDFNKDPIYSLPDFDLECIGVKPYKGPHPIGPSTIFAVYPRGQGDGSKKYLVWNTGTGINVPFRFELNGEKFVFQLWKGITVWEDEKFEGIAMNIELKDKNPLDSID